MGDWFIPRIMPSAAAFRLAQVPAVVHEDELALGGCEHALERRDGGARRARAAADAVVRAEQDAVRPDPVDAQAHPFADAGVRAEVEIQTARRAIRVLDPVAWPPGRSTRTGKAGSPRASRSRR